MVEQTVEEKTGAGGKPVEDMDLDELDELEDEEDERVLQQYRYSEYLLIRVRAIITDLYLYLHCGRFPYNVLTMHISWLL